MKTTNWMKGLLFAEYERKRGEGLGCTKIEINKHLWSVYRTQVKGFPMGADWVSGFNSYRNAYLKGKIV